MLNQHSTATQARTRRAASTLRRVFAVPCNSWNDADTMTIKHHNTVYEARRECMQKEAADRVLNFEKEATHYMLIEKSCESRLHRACQSLSSGILQQIAGFKAARASSKRRSDEALIASALLFGHSLLPRKLSIEKKAAAEARATFHIRLIRFRELPRPIKSSDDGAA